MSPRTDNLNDMANTPASDAAPASTQTKGAGAVQTHVPRVLTISISLFVRPGLLANIRMKRVQAAIDYFDGLVKGAAAHAFPWASEIEIDVTYDYRWLNRRGGRTPLPATPENTP
jgi:hypothetical protein